MANKSVYQDYNQDALDHFGLKIGDPCTDLYGVIQSQKVEEVLITQDETTFKKIRDILSTKNLTDVQFQSCKRGFILPGCPTSIDRIKAACKEHKITITNDYEKADFIIAHGDIYEKFRNGETILTTKVMYGLWNYECYNDSNGTIKAVDNYNSKVIYDDKWDKLGANSWKCNGHTALMDEWGIPGLAINLAFLIDTGEMNVFDVESVLHNSANKIELTSELVKDLTSWLDNYDTENIAIAGKILPTIDYTKKPHLLWQEIYSKTHKFSRDKDVQYWLEQSKIEDFYHYSAEDMIKWLEEEELLNEISFRYLEPIVRKEISIDNRELYVFKVSVKPEYKKYLK